jgi:hypothetical protein
MDEQGDDSHEFFQLWPQLSSTDVQFHLQMKIPARTMQSTDEI